jgi:hypothetical protein
MLVAAGLTFSGIAYKADAALITQTYMLQGEPRFVTSLPDDTANPRPRLNAIFTITYDNSDTGQFRSGGVEFIASNFYVSPNIGYTYNIGGGEDDLYIYGEADGPFVIHSPGDFWINISNVSTSPNLFYFAAMDINGITYQGYAPESTVRLIPVPEPSAGFIFAAALALFGLLSVVGRIGQVGADTKTFSA